MANNNGSKLVTVDMLGQMLNKYFIPVYKNLNELNSKVDGVISKDLNELNIKVDRIINKDLRELNSKVDTVERIQLRMENKLMDDNKILYDRGDAHDKKLRNHEKRLSRLER